MVPLRAAGAVVCYKVSCVCPCRWNGDGARVLLHRDVQGILFRRRGRRDDVGQIRAHASRQVRAPPPPVPPFPPFSPNAVDSYPPVFLCCEPRPRRNSLP